MVKDLRALALGAALAFAPASAPAGTLYEMDDSLRSIIASEVNKRPDHQILKAYAILLKNFSDDMRYWNRYHADDVFRGDVAEFYEQAQTLEECLAADYAIRWLEKNRHTRNKFQPSDLIGSIAGFGFLR